MINKIKTKISEGIHWKEDHCSAWEPIVGLNQDGITQFQLICLGKMRDNQLIESVNLQGFKEKYFKGSITGTINKFYVYEDGAELNGPDIEHRFERWNFKTPEELINQLIEETNKIKI